MFLLVFPLACACESRRETKRSFSPFPFFPMAGENPPKLNPFLAYLLFSNLFEEEDVREIRHIPHRHRKRRETKVVIEKPERAPPVTKESTKPQTPETRITTEKPKKVERPVVTPTVPPKKVKPSPTPAPAQAPPI